MTQKTVRLALALAGVLAAGPAFADAALDPFAAAGKVIFEETAGGVGCAACHGVDAKGAEGPDIRGRDPAAILEQLQVNDSMAFIELTPEQLDQVAAYLRYLHDAAAH